MTLTQVYGVSSVTDANGVVKEEVTPLSLSIDAGEPLCRIKCELGMTINLGKYQNAKILVAAEAPSNMDTDSLDKTFEFLKEWVDTKMVGMKEEIVKDIEA